MSTWDPDDLAMLADYECPDCGPLVEEDGTTTLHPSQANEILGGDEEGVLRCPDCGEELEQTMDALLGMLQLVAERFPGLAPTIADSVGAVLTEHTDRPTTT